MLPCFVLDPHLEGKPTLVEIRCGSKYPESVPQQLVSCLHICSYLLIALAQARHVSGTSLSFQYTCQLERFVDIPMRSAAKDGALWNSTEHECFSSPVTVQPCWHSGSPAGQQQMSSSATTSSDAVP